MKFIEINDGLSIRKEEIIAVARLENNRSNIFTENGTFECSFSYSTVLALLEMDKLEDKVADATKAQTVNSGMWGNQHWSG